MVAGLGSLTPGHLAGGSATVAVERSGSVGEKQRLHPLPLGPVSFTRGENDPNGEPIALVPPGIEHGFALVKPDWAMRHQGTVFSKGAIHGEERMRGGCFEEISLLAKWPDGDSKWSASQRTRSANNRCRQH